MPNNETIERIAEKYRLAIGTGMMKMEELTAALSEMRTVALREAAEIADDVIKQFLSAGDSAGAAVKVRREILGRIDK